MLGLVVGALVALLLIAVGAGALLVPRMASQQFGIVLDDPRALGFIRAIGARDLLIGVLQSASC
jgi:hypothetical protein